MSSSCWYVRRDERKKASGANLTSISKERFIEWVNTRNDVHWVPMIDMANEFRKKRSPPEGARMPAGFQGV